MAVQPTHSSNRILLPARNWFIALSIAVALLLNLIPFGRLPVIPDWVALVLTFWCIHQSLKVGMGAAFFLGLAMDVADVTEADVDYIYEPSAEGVLAELLPRYIEMTIYQAILENEASELSARMVAMRNATDAAKDMISTLTLVYNKARQEQVTKELLDIVGGVEAMSAR